MSWFSPLQSWPETPIPRQTYPTDAAAWTDLPSDPVAAADHASLSLWPLAIGFVAILLIVGTVLRFALKAKPPEPVNAQQAEPMLEDTDPLDVPEA
jgi:hypothetical protein